MQTTSLSQLMKLVKSNAQMYGNTKLLLINEKKAGRHKLFLKITSRGKV